MEWAEKIPEILPEDRLEICISWLGPDERKFMILGKGAKPENIVLLLQSKWEKEE